MGLSMRHLATPSRSCIISRGGRLEQRGFVAEVVVTN